MPVAFTSNNGSTFYNINDCKSFTQSIANTLVALSAYPCSEVILVNKGTSAVLIYDNNNFADANSLTLSAGETFTIRGITSASLVSAKAVTSTTLYYRTQYFSYLPQR